MKAYVSRVAIFDIDGALPRGGSLGDGRTKGRPPRCATTKLHRPSPRRRPSSTKLSWKPLEKMELLLISSTFR
uniref:Uncharacterized protein n=1 Tax=Triticum urartu TaxID=4572 RepID=A0A8R7TR90_TRIUA